MWADSKGPSDNWASPFPSFASIMSAACPDYRAINVMEFLVLTKTMARNLFPSLVSNRLNGCQSEFPILLDA